MTWNIKSEEINNTINKKNWRRLKGGERIPLSSKHENGIVEVIKRCNNADVAIKYNTIIKYFLYLEEIEYIRAK